MAGRPGTGVPPVPPWLRGRLGGLGLGVLAAGGVEELDATGDDLELLAAEPSSACHSECCRRPSIATRRPLARYLSQTSAWLSKTVTSTKSAPRSSPFARAAAPRAAASDRGLAMLLSFRVGREPADEIDYLELRGRGFSTARVVMSWPS